MDGHSGDFILCLMLCIGQTTIEFMKDITKIFREN